MKQKMIIIILITITGIPLHAQNFNEWFRQKKTQIKYLNTQIAELEAQLLLLKKGYDIAKDGWDAIHDITQGELYLHKTYFSSLDNINPAIDSDPGRTIKEIKKLIANSK